MRLTADEVARTHTQVFNAALLSRDLDTLATLYADDYMLVRPDGSVLSKDEVLNDLREGGLTFKSIEVKNVNVRVHGTAALLTAESWTATSTLGQEARAHIRLLAMYVTDSNGLRLTHFQSVLLHAWHGSFQASLQLRDSWCAAADAGVTRHTTDIGMETTCER